MTEKTSYDFQTETKQILDLMIHSVYSEKDIFLREIISNASDALDKLHFQSLIDKELTDFAKDPYIRIETDNKNRAIIIHDNGIGMNKKVAAKAFNPFFTTKPPGEGTGLGLSMSYDIITKQYGGDMSVSSQPGIGTTFKFSLKRVS